MTWLQTIFSGGCSASAALSMLQGYLVLFGVHRESWVTRFNQRLGLLLAVVFFVAALMVTAVDG